MSKINIARLKIGDKVHYTPFEGCSDDLIENGVVKEIPDHTNISELDLDLWHVYAKGLIRVVFNCAGEWDNFKNYTSQLTPIDKLAMGWVHSEIIKNENET
jgi:hypothetical protein